MIHEGRLLTPGETNARWALQLEEQSRWGPGHDVAFEEALRHRLLRFRQRQWGRIGEGRFDAEVTPGEVAGLVW